VTYNAAAARAKRPCPLWVDAFLRDTQHLAADEVGAYMLILMVMWSREACDYPDDDHRLARVCRVSLRLWKSRLGPAIRPFFTTENGALISKRLRQEAAYVETGLQAQSDRRSGTSPKGSTYALPNCSDIVSEKNGEEADKPLEYNEPAATADNPGSNPQPTPDHPTQLPNYPTLEGSVVGAPARKRTLCDRVMIALGLNPDDSRSTGWMPPTSEMHVGRWRDDLKLTEDEIVEVALGTRKRWTTPPRGPGALNDPMRAFSAAKFAEALTPITPKPTQGGDYDRRPQPARASRSTASLDAALAGARRLPGSPR
jgi:uncharacterized protein YdaU (DUF1376 family)